MQSAEAMSTYSQADSERLLQENQWVRNLARSLVGDTDLADDLTQETWLRALQSPPQTDGSDQQPITAWLGTVLRNLLRQRHRSEGRRLDREERAAREERLPSTLELVERVSIQRDVAQAVMDLEEPYRTALLLRYFEELPPRSIAERTGIPVATVKTQLQRGLDKLREQLDERHHGDRSSWLMALFPLASPPAQVTSKAVKIGVLLVSSKVLFVAIAALLTSGVYAILAFQENSVEVASASAEAPHEEAQLKRTLQGSTEPTKQAALAQADNREALIAPVATKSDPAEVVLPPTVLKTLHVRVLDSEGDPLTGVEISASGPTFTLEQDTPIVGRSGPDGRFTLEVSDRISAVISNDERYATVLAATTSVRGTQTESILILGERMDVTGRVLDELGLPLQGATVSYVLPEGFRARFSEVLDYSNSLVWKTKSDAEGAYALHDLPQVRGAILKGLLEGYDASEELAPQTSTNAHDLFLAPPTITPNSLRGRIVDPVGAPVEKASVSFGLVAQLTDENGLFAFDTADESGFNARFDITPQRLIAVKRGYLPAYEVLSTKDGRVQPQGFVVMQLGGSALSIEGRVLDGDGTPLAGMHVWIADPTTFGAHQGARRPNVLENILAGRDNDGWHFEETDKLGRFRIEGLADREYELVAMDVSTLLRTDPITVDAGSSSLDLRFPEDAYFETVSGRVVTWTGAPLEGLDIVTMCDAFASKFQGNTIMTHHETASATTTDEDGRFELKQVPRNLVYLRIEGESSIPLEFGRGVEGGILELTGGKIEEIEIVVTLRCHFRVELDINSPVDEVAVLDGGGAEMLIDSFEGNSRFTHERMPVSEGKTSVLTVPDSARTLILFSQGEELERRELSLAAGDVHVIN